MAALHLLILSFLVCDDDRLNTLDSDRQFPLNNITATDHSAALVSFCRLV